MKCPICGKELELQNKQIGTDENGDPVFNEYAICRDCKKQWNLDKQRAKRAAARKAAQEASAKKEVPVRETSQTRKAPEKEAASKQEEPVKKPAPKREEPAKKAAPKRRQPSEAEPSQEPVRKPVRKRRAEGDEPDGEKRYSNIPPEKVRVKHEKAARKSYGDMLETGTIGKKPLKKRKRQLEDETGEIRRNRDYEAKADEYDGDEYYDDDPRFRPMRIILGIISLAGFAYFIYRGFVTGLADTTDGGAVSSGMTYVILALCMLVSALLYFIMQSKNTVFAFLLPMIFYLGDAVFAFIQRGDDLQLFIAAIAGAVLAVISLILAITSRGGGYEDEEEDYDDAFEDDYADDDYDD